MLLKFLWVGLFWFAPEGQAADEPAPQRPAETASIPYKVLKGQIPARLAQFKLLGPVEGEKILKISVSLEENNKQGLETALKDMYDPKSPHFRKFLSKEQFKDQYSPNQKQVDEVVQFLQKHSIQVEEVHSNRLLIQAKGTVKQINEAFRTQIDYYSGDKQTGQVYAPSVDVQVPDSLKILAIFGLHNLIQIHPGPIPRLSPGPLGSDLPKKAEHP